MYNYDMGGAGDPQYMAAYRQAERRVKAKIGFYWHLASYVLVNGFLIIIYLITGLIPGFYTYPWFVWPMFGWGIGLLFHFLAVFISGNTTSEENRRRMIEAEMRRMGAYPPTGTSNIPYGGAGSNTIPPDQK